MTTSPSPPNPAVPNPPVKTSTDEPDEQGKAESLRIIGGLIAVGMGLLLVFLLGAGALIVFAIKGKLGSGLVSIITAGFGVIGTLVGAYFGLKIGTDEAKAASTAAQAAEAKSDVYAAFLPESRAQEATNAAHNAAAAVREQAKGS